VKGGGSTIPAARLVVFATFLDLFVQFPVVAPFARTLGATPVLVGLIVGVYSLTNLLGNLAAGVVLDRWGRKGPVLVGMVATAAVVAGYALVRTPEQLLGVRAAHGLATAVLTPGAFALIGDSAALDRRARVMGVSGAIIAVAATIGPPLASAVADRAGVGALFLGTAAFMAVTAAVFAIWAREAGRPDDRAAPVEDAPAAYVGGQAGYLSLWTRPGLVTAYAAALALTTGLGTLVTHLPQVLVARGESGARGAVFTMYAVLAVISMAGPLGRMSDRVPGRRGPLAAGLASIGLGMLILAIAPSLVGAMAGMAVFGLGFGVLFPAAAALVVESADRGERGAAFGVFYGVYSFGVVVGSVMSGMLGGWGEGLPFLVGAAVALGAAPLVLTIGRRVVVSEGRASV
jgi:DHA1 family multidrug resistance protein-like MFS transporter